MIVSTRQQQSKVIDARDEVSRLGEGITKEIHPALNGEGQSALDAPSKRTCSENGLPPNGLNEVKFGAGIVKPVPARRIIPASRQTVRGTSSASARHARRPGHDPLSTSTPGLNLAALPSGLSAVLNRLASASRPLTRRVAAEVASLVKASPRPVAGPRPRSCASRLRSPQRSRTLKRPPDADFF